MRSTLIVVSLLASAPWLAVGCGGNKVDSSGSGVDPGDAGDGAGGDDGPGGRSGGAGGRPSSGGSPHSAAGGLPSYAGGYPNSNTGGQPPPAAGGCGWGGAMLINCDLPYGYYGPGQAAVLEVPVREGDALPADYWVEVCRNEACSVGGIAEMISGPVALEGQRGDALTLGGVLSEGFWVLRAHWAWNVADEGLLDGDTYWLRVADPSGSTLAWERKRATYGEFTYTTPSWQPTCQPGAETCLSTTLVDVPLDGPLEPFPLPGTLDAGTEGGAR